jgi:hypothetical protein
MDTAGTRAGEKQRSIDLFVDELNQNLAQSGH